MNNFLGMISLQNKLRRFRQQRQLNRYIDRYYSDDFAALAPGAIAIDCGANIGNVTAHMAARGATVHAFEPDPAAYAALARRFSQARDVHVYPKGVWDKDATVKLYHHRQMRDNPLKWSVGSSLLKKKSNVDPSLYDSIQVIDIANFIASLDQPVALMKIDVEGVEYDIIQRLLQTDAISRIKRILVEPHEEQLPQLAAQAQTVKSQLKQRHITSVDFNWK